MISELGLVNDTVYSIINLDKPCGNNTLRAAFYLLLAMKFLFLKMDRNIHIYISV